MNWWVSLTLYLSVFSTVPAIWLGRKQRGLLWYYAWASLISDMLPFAQQRLSGTVSFIQGNLFIVCELVFVGLYFMREMRSALVRRVTLALIIALSVAFLIRAWPTINQRVSWEDVSLIYIFFLLLCMTALIRVIRNVEHLKIEQSPLFIFAASFLLYVAYSLLLMLFTEQFMHASASLRKNIWAVHNVLNILKNLAIAYIFVMPRKEVP